MIQSYRHAHALIQACVAQGITDIVVCPGSRNSALSLMAARSALRVHTRVDERSASFFALGLARVQRRAVPVVVTSGTAVANCVPAAVEAYYADLPFMVLSADRPARMVGTGASQTIDQRGLFGMFAPLVEPQEGEDEAALVARAVAQQRAQVNLPFDMPLVDAQVPPREQPLPQRAWAPAAPRAEWAVDYGTIDLDLSKRTLVIAGDGAWEEPALAEVPTIAEPSAYAPYRPVHPLAASFFLRPQARSTGADGTEYVVDTQPEQVVVVGHPTLHRPVLQLLNQPDIELFVLSRGHTPTDPARRATTVPGRVGSAVRATGAPTSQWLRMCEAASNLGATAVREALEDPEFGFTGLHVAAAVADTLGVGDTVTIGASNPIRDASLVGLPFDGVSCYSPRGAAGIDGTVSQALGVALAAQDVSYLLWQRPRSVALLGDVTFLHDAAGLLAPAGSPRPEALTIVVANDNGGGIFEALEPGQEALREDFEQVFGTPHDADIEALCQGYGVHYRAAESTQELLAALLDAQEQPDGVVVIEARCTRATRRALARRLDQAMSV